MRPARVVVGVILKEARSAVATSRTTAPPDSREKVLPAVKTSARQDVEIKGGDGRMMLINTAMVARMGY